MNLLTAICLIATSAQMVAPPPTGGTGQAAASSQAAGDGWHRNEDDSLSFIMHISPTEIAKIADGGELAVVIPPFVRPEVAQVIVRIGDSAPERDPPEAELIERQRQRQLSGPSLSLATPMNRGNGGYKTIDSASGGEEPLLQTQFAPPTTPAGQTSMQTLPSTTASNNYGQTNLQSRNPAVGGRGTTDPRTGYPTTASGGFNSDPPSMFPPATQQPPYASSNSGLVTQPPAGTQYSTPPINPATRPAANDSFTGAQPYGNTQPNAYGQQANNGYSYGSGADYRSGGSNLLTPGSNGQYTPTSQGYPNNGGYAGQLNPNLGGQMYSDPNGLRLASNPAVGGNFGSNLGGNIGTLPGERAYTPGEVRSEVERAREEERRSLEQKFEQAKQTFSLQVNEAKAKDIEVALEKAAEEHASRSVFWQFMLVASIAVNGYMFVLLRSLFTKYRNLQQNTRNSMSLAT